MGLGLDSTDYLLPKITMSLSVYCSKCYI